MQAVSNSNLTPTDSQQPNTDLSQMDEIELAQRFVDLHHSGDKAAARPYLAELIRRNELQRGLQALAAKKSEEVQRG